MLKITTNYAHGPCLAFLGPAKTPLVVLFIRCGGWSSAHGAVLAARALLELRIALFVDALPAASKPHKLGRPPRKRLEADRADLSLLLLLLLGGGVRVGVSLVVIRHEAGHDRFGRERLQRERQSIQS